MSQALYPAASNRFLNHETRQRVNGAEMEPPAIEYFYLAVETVPGVKPIAAAIAPDLSIAHDLVFFEVVKDRRGRDGMPSDHSSIM